MDSGIEEIIFITSDRKPEIKDYFTKNDNLEAKLSESKKRIIK